MQLHYFETSFRRSRSHFTIANTIVCPPDFARIRGHVSNAIANQIEEAICFGSFKPGDKLPTQRSIAEIIGLHPNTVYAEYFELALRGLTKGCVHRGTFVIDRTTHKASTYTQLSV
ncbi:GntR family transcriptional regulator [Burkholderia pseudomallei]|uniref:GntR family transcriptional regulator n=1 Tax=Burkholderia pseudomallei TaxID=28450 RepID=UPI000531A5CE|nr:GntR family transcriptional regulator [Burkholderia pseudomallei]KGS07526.1 bacterial regulatory s, gntR family protein [Burkholderia pseudomallei MSHR5608]